jgi:predicted membrane metal-binding protein
MLPRVLQLLEHALAGAALARQWTAFWGPVIDVRSLTAALLAVFSVLALALLSGVAVSSLVSLVMTLAALYVLLTEVFGVTVELAPPPGARR